MAIAKKQSSKKASSDKRQDMHIHKVRHSLSHILAIAVLEKFPTTHLGIGPVIENGFYYDFDFGKKQRLSDADLPHIETRMKELIAEHLIFDTLTLTYPAAKKMFATQPYKLELIEELKKNKKKITVYTTSRKNGSKKEVIFRDLCAGPHVKNTKEIPVDSFCLSSLAGAYWRGDEKNTMLTRIYGFGFLSPQDLDEYLTRQSEALKRDHRKLGKELDLFHTDDMVGLGLPLWHPKGALLWRTIEDFWYKKHLENGYDLVRTPHIGNRILWETSGHWGFYNKSMYPPLEIGQTLEEKQQHQKTKVSEEYLLKPMNCPFHVQIYKNTPHSYREFPFRWAECGTVYRFEKKGELSGLTRVRGFTQDDAHIICRKDQVEDELKRVVDFILFIYQSFGFNVQDVHVYLSLRDPKNKEKYTGNDAGWKFTESVLRKIAKEKNLNFTEELGEAAFYGPKLDFKIKDAIGREWQCSTLQFDFNLPERFDLTFINDKGKEERPYMLHRALFGSYERFIGLLIEHYAGAFPLWLAPVQVAILPISERHDAYARTISDSLRTQHIRTITSNENETLGKRIRDIEMQKVPYILVVGDKEQESKTVAVRARHNKDARTIPLSDFIKTVTDEIADKQ